MTLDDVVAVACVFAFYAITDRLLTGQSYGQIIATYPPRFG